MARMRGNTSAKREMSVRDPETYLPRIFIHGRTPAWLDTGLQGTVGRPRQAVKSARDYAESRAVNPRHEVIPLILFIKDA
jgi:hypothetical protein